MPRGSELPLAIRWLTKHRGAGVVLSIARQLAEAQGSAIGAHNQPGGGLVVLVVLA